MNHGPRYADPRDMRRTRRGTIVFLAIVVLMLVLSAFSGEDEAQYSEFHNIPSEQTELEAMFEEDSDPEAALRELRALREEIEWLDEHGDELRRLMDLHEQGKLWSA